MNDVSGAALGEEVDLRGSYRAMLRIGRLPSETRLAP